MASLSRLLRISSRVVLKITEWTLRVGLYASSGLPWMTRIPTSVVLQSGLGLVQWTQYLMTEATPLLLE